MIVTVALTVFVTVKLEPDLSTKRDAYGGGHGGGGGRACDCSPRPVAWGYFTLPGMVSEQEPVTVMAASSELQLQLAPPIISTFTLGGAGRPVPCAFHVNFTLMMPVVVAVRVWPGDKPPCWYDGPDKPHWVVVSLPGEPLAFVILRLLEPL